MTINSPEGNLFNVAVVNLNGKTLYSRPNVPSETEITVDHSFVPGVYILIVSNNDTRMQMRIVKY
jgi:hypothetical protein